MVRCYGGRPRLPPVSAGVATEQAEQPVLQRGVGRHGDLRPAHARSAQVVAEALGHRPRSRSTSAGSIVSSCPVARARSHPWTTRSKPRNGRSWSPTVVRPSSPSYSWPASAGSSSTASTSVRAASNAPSGSSATDGAGLERAVERAEHHAVDVDDVGDDAAGVPLLARRRVRPAVGTDVGDLGLEGVGERAVAVGDLGHASIVDGAGPADVLYRSAIRHAAGTVRRDRPAAADAGRRTAGRRG